MNMECEETKIFTIMKAGVQVGFVFMSSNIFDCQIVWNNFYFILRLVMFDWGSITSLSVSSRVLHRYATLDRNKTQNASSM